MTDHLLAVGGGFAGGAVVMAALWFATRYAPALMARGAPTWPGWQDCMGGREIGAQNGPQVDHAKGT